MFDTILVALESSQIDAALLAAVGRLTRREDVTLVLFHAVDPEAGEEYGGADVSISLRKQSAERRLQELAEGLSAEGLTVRSKVMLGDPATLICSQAEAEGARLVALATHGRWGPSRWVAGSVTESVLRKARVPLLVINPKRAAPSTTGGFEKVLVPLDGSERAARILPLVDAFARLYGAEVTLLRAGVYPPVPPMQVPLTGLEAIGPLRQAYEEEADAFRERLTAPSRVVVVFADTAAQAILETAREGGYDLIAIGTHGRTGLDRLLFGSTAEAVARDASVPLLVWRDEDLVEDEGSS